MSGIKLPKAVQRQADAADEALKAMQGTESNEDGQYVGQGEPNTDTAPTDDGNTPDPQAAPPATPEDESEDDNQGTDDLSVNWKEEAEAMQVERDKALAKFSSLQGKYNAEIPRLNDEIRTLKGEIETLKTATPEPTVDAPQLEQMREMYGDEMADAYIAQEQKIARLEKALDKTTEKLSRVDDLEQSATQDADRALFESIGKAHPDWEKIDGLATFHKFLAEVNPDTGEPRQVAIDRAMQRRDPKPIIRQLAAFKRRAKSGSQALENQVVPGDSGRADPAPQADTKIYNAKDVDLFFRKMATNQSRGVPPSDSDKSLDALYTKAMLDGRVR